VRCWLPRSRLVPAFAVLLSAVVSAQVARVANDRDPAVLARLAEDARAGMPTPALAAAVVSGDAIVWAQGFGFANLEQGSPAAADTVFRIASISKPITATAVMQLVARGLVSLEDPVQRFVPSFPRKPQGEIRIRHLLSHTSGIRHYRGNEFASRDTYHSLDGAMLVFKHDPLVFAPGERYLYTTYGFNLLASVVEAVSGRSFEEYLRLNIFVPSGMTTTMLERPQDLVKFRAQPYVRGPGLGTWLNAPYVDLSVKWAGGGMLSTATDLARFDIALNSGRLLRPDTLDRMHAPTRLNSGALTGYGLGWMVNPSSGRTIVAHSGGAMGGTTYFLREPKARLATVLLANTDNVPRLRELAEQLMALAPRPGIMTAR
jgi:CubicO group peptidase (beta-lactamase class C family)